MYALITGTGIDIKQKPVRGCCWESRSRTLFLPYYNVLNAATTSSGVRFSYVHPARPHKLESVVVEIRKPRNSLEFDNEASLTSTEDPTNLLGTSPILRKRLLVIINPHGGPGNADALFRKFCRPIFDTAGAECIVHYTNYTGHARDMVREADFTGIDAIVCVSGDGIPYEVINGLMDRSDDIIKQVPVCQLPGGSGNAMSHSVTGGDNFALGCLNILKGQAINADLMYITQGDQATYSFLSQSFGVVADCDLGTEHLRWMGPARFTVGVIMKTLGSSRYPCKIAYKRASTHISSSSSPQFGNVNDELPSDWSVEVHPDLSMFYVGKMTYMSADTLVFPRAKPDDACMDMILWDNTVGTIRGLQLLDKMSRGEHVHERDIRYEKVVAYRLIPESPMGHLSVDGEAYSCDPIQVEVLHDSCLFIAPHGEYYLPNLI